MTCSTTCGFLLQRRLSRRQLQSGKLLLLFDHPQSVVVFLSVCLSDDNCRKPSRMKVNVCTSGMSLGSTGQVRIWRSSGQGQGHRSKKGRKSPFPQCESSIGDNSGSIKNRAMTFACVMGFSTMDDRMLWPPSLSRDRKWPTRRDARIYIRGQIFCGYPQFPTDTDRIRISIWRKAIFC